MRDTLELTKPIRRADPDQREEQDVTMPIRIVCCQGGQRNARTHWMKKKGESAPRRTPDWKEIGEPS